MMSTDLNKERKEYFKALLNRSYRALRKRAGGPRCLDPAQGFKKYIVSHATFLKICPLITAIIYIVLDMLLLHLEDQC